jgi:xylulose-5-phosphate/fructose-6-phosphate phosphoketolase
MKTAIEHCRQGASVWPWASNNAGTEPDVVLAAAGDIPTLETVAAAWWLRKVIPELKVRVVNVVDLMTLFTPDAHPHGMEPARFEELFTAAKPVIFAFHGYQRAIHELGMDDRIPIASMCVASSSRGPRRHRSIWS